MAFAELCPSITIEAGLPGNTLATTAVTDLLENVIHLESFERITLSKDLKIFHTFGRIKVAACASVDFAFCRDSLCDLSFDCSLDDKNFESLPINTVLGFIRKPQVLTVIDNRGLDITNKILSFDDGEIKTKKMIIPSMFTKNVQIIKDDSLGYLMETMSFN